MLRYRKGGNHVHGNRWMLVALIAVGGLQLSACRETAADAAAEVEHAATVEAVKGTNLHRVILDAKAGERLGIETASVQDARGQTMVVPYSAVLYDPQGRTWVYTNAEPMTFVRHRIHVEFIKGNMAVLSDGPASGTEIVTVGAAELYGTEFGVGH